MPDRMNRDAESVAIRVRTTLSGDFDQRAAIWAAATAYSILIVCGKANLI